MTAARRRKPPAKLSETLFVRLSLDDRTRLDALGALFPLKRSAIARLALRIGLGELAADPFKALHIPPGAPRPRTRKLSKAWSRARRKA